jgi:hypothetical protein
MRKTRSSTSQKGRDRVRALPWATLVQVAFVLGRRVGKLSPRDRARLGSLLRESRGWPGRLRAKERAELRKLVGKLDLKSMGRELTPLARGRRRKRR